MNHSNRVDDNSISFVMCTCSGIPSQRDRLSLASESVYSVVDDVCAQSVSARRSKHSRSTTEVAALHTTHCIASSHNATSEVDGARRVCGSRPVEQNAEESVSFEVGSLSDVTRNVLHTHNDSPAMSSEDGGDSGSACAKPCNRSDTARHSSKRVAPTPSFCSVVMRWLVCGRAYSARQMLWIALLVLLLGGGNVLQILMLNFWLQSFPGGSSSTGEALIPGNYTVFAIPGIVYALMFGVALLVYVILRRPRMGFARQSYGFWLICGIGLLDTLNSWMSSYAATYTNEMLQVLFTSLSPLYAVVMCKYILHDPRSYVNRYMAIVFVLTVVGVLPASLYGLLVRKPSSNSSSDGGGKAVSNRDKQLWTFIFFASIPLRVLMNVWQTLYMIIYTDDYQFARWLHTSRRDTQCDEEELVRAIEENKGSRPCATRPRINDALEATHEQQTRASPSTNEARHGQRGVGVNDTHTHAVNIHDPHLCGLNPRVHATQQGSHAPHERANRHTPRTPHALPSACDASSPFAPAPAVRVTAGMRACQGTDMTVKLVMLAGDTVTQACFTLALLPADALPWWGNSTTVHSTWTNFMYGTHCVFTIPDNFCYAFLFTLGFIMSYVGAAYLNYYSAATCTIISNLSSPLTALLLIAAPRLNVVDEVAIPWYYNALAVVLLAVAAMLYVVWEESTNEKKAEGERQLKLRHLRQMGGIVAE